MLKKSVHFRWDDEQEDAFVKLKEALCKASVLAYLDPDLPYIVDMDASNLAIGAVLSQVHDSEEKDPELCRFIELLHKHAIKPKSKLLTAEPPDVKVLCTLWYEFHVWDEILYRTGKKVDDEWQLVIPREKHTEILSMLHDSKTAGYVPDEINHQR